MFDLKLFEDQFDEMKRKLSKRNLTPEVLNGIQALVAQRKKGLQDLELKKSLRNKVSQEIAQLKARAKTDPAAAAEADKKVAAMKEEGDRVKALEQEFKSLDEKMKDMVAAIPNIPDDSVPEGKDETGNVKVHAHGDPAKFSFGPVDHVALGEKLKLIDFERASKVSGARFIFYTGRGAALERALIQFMLDLHIREHGYQEMMPPFLVGPSALYGTSQLPKFENDLFKTGVDDRTLYLIPTAEVPVTNFHADEILDEKDMPVKYTASSSCFRSEAGSYGRDTRGLIRQHQFQKVELVKIATADTSYAELESMRKNAERVLELLELPYRTMLLCGGDMGFASAKTYDLEVWLPSQNLYREISSCSNCTDFQSRRALIRYRKEAGDKPAYAHTLNGSGLAVGRTWVAVLENGQNEEGEVKIPRVLNKYLDGYPGFTRRGEDLWISH